jgi:hypothetical protein
MTFMDTHGGVQMEKISGILPASSRITSVDLRNSGVARSGTPSFGRPTGTSAPAEREIETARMAMERHGEIMELREPNRKDEQLAIVDKIADDFFMRKGRPDQVQNEVVETTEIDWDQPALGGNLDVIA